MLQRKEKLKLNRKIVDVSRMINFTSIISYDNSGNQATFDDIGVSAKQIKEVVEYFEHWVSNPNLAVKTLSRSIEEIIDGWKIFRLETFAFAAFSTHGKLYIETNP